MLRSLVLILLFVNAAFFAWSQGWLNDVVGVRPDAQREPQRLTQQINPDKIVVAKATALTPDEGSGMAQGTSASSEASAQDTAEGGADAAASAVNDAAGGPDGAASSAVTAPATASVSLPSAPAPAPAPPAAAATKIAAASVPNNAKAICIEAGPFSATEYASAEAVVRPLLPAGSWARQTVALQGMWLVYMGPYAQADQLLRKQEELKRIKDLDFEVVRTPAHLAQGISLGRFSKRENADNQLEILKGRGIRTARIVVLRPATEQQWVRVPRADVDAQVKLAGVKLPQGKGFTACRP